MTAAKQARAQYTQEFKLEAVRQVSAGQAIAVVAKVLGIPVSLTCPSQPYQRNFQEVRQPGE